MAFLGVQDFDKNIIDESINTFNGFGFNFEEAYNNVITGEILSDIIGSQKFFGSKIINLVGHGLGCRVIYSCFKHFSKNYKTITETINDAFWLVQQQYINMN